MIIDNFNQKIKIGDIGIYTSNFVSNNLQIVEVISINKNIVINGQIRPEKTMIVFLNLFTNKDDFCYLHKNEIKVKNFVKINDDFKTQLTLLKLKNI